MRIVGQEAFKHYLKSFVHAWRVMFCGACRDPDCTGTMEIYDDRVHRDYCSVCRKTRGTFDCEAKRKAACK